MTDVTKQQLTPSTDKLAALQQRMSIEIERHEKEVRAIQREMQDATRNGAQSLIKSDRDDDLIYGYKGPLSHRGN